MLARAPTVLSRAPTKSLSRISNVSTSGGASTGSAPLGDGRLCYLGARRPPTLVVRLDEPLAESTAGVAFMAVCAQLHNVVEREVRLEDVHGEEVSNEALFAMPATQAYQAQLETTLHDWGKHPSIRAALESTKLAFVFPILGSLYCDEDLVYDDGNIKWEDYLRVLGLMNQLHYLTRLLREDLRNPSQKYVAHQVALLYQGVRRIGGRELRQFRTRIEEHFATIKAVAESDEPTLPPQLADWLEDTTLAIDAAMETAIARKFGARFKSVLK